MCGTISMFTSTRTIRCINFVELTARVRIRVKQFVSTFSICSVFYQYSSNNNYMTLIKLDAEAFLVNYLTPSLKSPPIIH